MKIFSFLKSGKIYSMLKKNISFALGLILMKGVAIAQTNNSAPAPPPVTNNKTEVPGEVIKNSDVNRSPKTYADANLIENKPQQTPLKDRKPGDRSYTYKGKKYDPVPILDNADYFGKNYQQMLDYTKKYMSSRTKTFSVVMQRNTSGKIFSTMDKIFDKYDIPHEMKYLSVIESALNNKALSPVGAYGPWQFMPSTGRMMGLKVSASVDERADWIKSTHAACKYLNYLYNMFDDWLLVVAAYNSGPRPVLNAIKKTGKNDFWSIKKYLPSETQNHVMAFVATATAFELLPMFATTGVPANFDWKVLKKTTTSGGIIEKDKERNPLQKKFSQEELQKMTIIKISDPLSLDVICNRLDIDIETMYRWNYDYFLYLDEFKTGDFYHLRIPKDKAERFIDDRVLITKESVKQRNY